jgi:hypothetical protein
MPPKEVNFPDEMKPPMPVGAETTRAKPPHAERL